MASSSLLEKQYTLSTTPAPLISWDDYSRESREEYEQLLENSKDEKEFQNFFERNPAFVPGINWPPRLSVLITQPKIQGIRERFPDFMWLRDDSLTFSPVLIEIESPSKKLFNTSGHPSGSFTEARNQLTEWKTILDGTAARQQFYEDFDIPPHLIRKKFKPLFRLVYGRREEFINDPMLTGKRANLMGENEELISYDRLQPHSAGENIVSVTVKNREYSAKYVMPRLRLGPVIAPDIARIKGLEGAIDSMERTSEDRKKFIKDRLSYWNEYAVHGGGLINRSDQE